MDENLLIPKVHDIDEEITIKRQEFNLEVETEE